MIAYKTPAPRISPPVFFAKALLIGLCTALTLTIAVYLSRAHNKIPLLSAASDFQDVIKQQRVNEVDIEGAYKNNRKLQASFGYIRKLQQFVGQKLAGQVAAEIEGKDGRIFYVFAKNGFSSRQDSVFDLVGEVNVATSDGYVLETSALRIFSDKEHIESITPVRLQFDNGWATADKILSVKKPDTQNSRIVILKGRVKFFIEP